MATYIGGDQVEIEIKGEVIILSENELENLIYDLMDHKCMKRAISNGRKDWYKRTKPKPKKEDNE